MIDMQTASSPTRGMILGAGLLLTLAYPALLTGATPSIPAIAVKQITTGLQYPVHITHAGDGSGRLYIVEQGGTIRILDRGRLQPTPFLDIRRRVTSGGERGLLSVAFHPRYRRNGRFYVNYTSGKGGLHTVVSEFRRRHSIQADSRHERVLLRIKQPYGNHNGGQLAFGPDGYLYIGMGDGGGANDPHGHGQNPATLLGALLRIDVNRTGNLRPYGIPRDNPFAKRRGYRPEIWAYGLRNPWRFSFDAKSGRLYLADVGQDAEEEIDIIQRGGNYGWRVMEGFRCTPDVNPDCDKSGYLRPIHSYSLNFGQSITGGHVYRGRRIPALIGTYVYADYMSGHLLGLRYNGRRITAKKIFAHYRKLRISSFGESEAGELFFTDLPAGAIYQLVPISH